MIKTGLYSKCLTYDFKKLFKSKGYTWFDKGAYNLNIIGIRKNNPNNKITNLYDDILIVDYNTEVGHKRQLFNITTEPGAYYMKKVSNPIGTAILVPNQYRGTWKIGLHRGKYKALVQYKPVSVYRDGNKDDIYDLEPTSIQNGLFGINIHRSNETWTRNTIDQYSAGCQVFNNPTDFNSFLRLCEKQKERYGNSFTYTLVNEDDLI